jgi:hypothetical protein
MIKNLIILAAVLCSLMFFRLIYLGESGIKGLQVLGVMIIVGVIFVQLIYDKTFRIKQSFSWEVALLLGSGAFKHDYSVPRLWAINKNKSYCPTAHVFYPVLFYAACNKAIANAGTTHLYHNRNFVQSILHYAISCLPNHDF